MFLPKTATYAIITILLSAAIAMAAQSAPEFRGVRIVREGAMHASSADAFADGIAAVNTRFCQRAPGYQSFANPDDPTVQYLIKGRFRHIRDGSNICAGDAAYARLVNALYRDHGIDLLATLEPCATDVEMRNFLAKFPAIRAVEGPNEYDESKPSMLASAPVAAGSRGISVSSDARTSFAIAQQYLFGEGPAQEPITVAACPDVHAIRTQMAVRHDHPGGFSTGLAQPSPIGSMSFVVHDASRFHAGEWVTLDCTSHSQVRETDQLTRIDKATMTVSAPLRFAHGRDAVIGESCLANGNGFVSDLSLLYARIAAVVKADPKSAEIPILADSQAEQADNDKFTGSGIDRFENVGNLHDYPGNRNPGGASGDGTVGFGSSFVGCGTYGAYWYQMCAESLQFAYVREGRQVKPVWTTEVSYNVAPVGGPWNTVQHAIPDDVAVKYLPRLEFFYHGNGHARVYWFELIDSASGCGNAFGAYGLVRNCPAGSAAAPKAEYNALTDLIARFGDVGCRYPSCAFRPGEATVSATGGDGSFQYHLFEKHDGSYLLAFWLERSDYDADSTAPCHLTLSCYVAVAPQSVTLSIRSSDGIEKPMLQTFTTNPTDARFGHLTRPTPTSISGSGAWSGPATDTVQILSWKGKRQ